jgi:hypothetical protein
MAGFCEYGNEHSTFVKTVFSLMSVIYTYELNVFPSTCVIPEKLMQV